MIALVAAVCRCLARLATWSAAVLTDTATQLQRAEQRAHDTKEFR